MQLNNVILGDWSSIGGTISESEEPFAIEALQTADSTYPDESSGILCDTTCVIGCQAIIDTIVGKRIPLCMLWPDISNPQNQWENKKHEVSQNQGFSVLQM